MLPTKAAPIASLNLSISPWSLKTKLHRNKTACSDSNPVQSENISTPIHVECEKMYRSNICVQEFWYFVSGLDIQNGSPVLCVQDCRSRIVLYAKKSVAGGEIQRVIYRFFFELLIRTNGLVVKVSRRESATWVRFLMIAETFSHSGHFAWY